MLRLIALYIVSAFVLGWLGTLFPERPNDILVVLYAVGSGVYAVIGPPLIAFQLGWIR